MAMNAHTRHDNAIRHNNIQAHNNGSRQTLPSYVFIEIVQI